MLSKFKEIIFKHGYIYSEKEEGVFIYKGMGNILFYGIIMLGGLFLGWFQGQNEYEYSSMSLNWFTSAFPYLIALIFGALFLLNLVSNLTYEISFKPNGIFVYRDLFETSGKRIIMDRERLRAIELRKKLSSDGLYIKGSMFLVFEGCKDIEFLYFKTKKENEEEMIKEFQIVKKGIEHLLGIIEAKP